MASDHWTWAGDDAQTVVEYTPDDGTRTSIAIVRAIAAIENVDPTDLEFTLYDYVNPEALDLLVDHEGAGNADVRFTMNGYRVRVRDTGEIVVREPK